MTPFIDCNSKRRWNGIDNYEVPEEVFQVELNQSIESGLIVDRQRGLFIREGYGAILGYCPEKCETIEELLIFSFNDFKRKTIGKPTIVERIREHLDQMQCENSPHYDYKKYIDQGYDLIIGPGGVVNGETWGKAVYCRNYEEILSMLEEQSQAMEDSSKSRGR